MARMNMHQMTVGQNKTQDLRFDVSTNISECARPAHGGDILAFCERTGRNPKDCIDLSTGIAPWAWPVPDIPAELWQRLPTSTSLESELLEVAATYYGCASSSLHAVAGSQSAIEIVPLIAKFAARIAIPAIGYKEHLYAWKMAGAKIVPYESNSELKKLVDDERVDYAVVINPNNPSGDVVSVNYLESIRQQLAGRGGFLVVDEAFIDPTPHLSMMLCLGREGLVVLRSVGKFFGLAGLRLGFFGAATALIESVRSQTPLWSLSTPALWIGKEMLGDRQWIEMQRRRCMHHSRELMTLLQHKFAQLCWARSDLFVVGRGSVNAIENCQNRLARLGIHVRLITVDQSSALIRIGLADEHGLEILDKIPEEELS